MCVIDCVPEFLQAFTGFKKQTSVNTPMCVMQYQYFFFLMLKRQRRNRGAQ